jgi:hypothetical protein
MSCRLWRSWSTMMDPRARIETAETTADKQ